MVPASGGRGEGLAEALHRATRTRFEREDVGTQRLILMFFLFWYFYGDVGGFILVVLMVIESDF